MRRRKSSRTYTPESGRLEKPTLFILHMFAAILVILKIAAMVSEDTPFIVASRGTFTDMFLAGVSRQGNIGFIYEIDTCLASINRSISTYYDLPAVGLDVYDALSTPIQIHVVHLKDNPREVLPRKGNTLVQDLETSERYANVSGKDDNWMRLIGIDEKSMNKKRSFFNSLVQLELLFQLRTLHREFDHVQLYDWEIVAHYNFISRGGRIELSLTVKGSHVRLDKSSHWELSLDVVMAIVALISQLAVNHGRQGIFSNFGRGWFHRNSWKLLTASADFCILAGVILDFSNYRRWTGEMRSFDLYLAGMACILSWSRIIQHLQSIPPYNMLILAMVRGVPVVVRFLVGSIPLLVGFAGLGMALFSEHTEKFASLENSVVTLFSVLNGDVLLETFRDMRPAGFVGDIFLVGFVCIFVYSGLNVLIFLIQDAYFSAKEQTLNSLPLGRQGIESSLDRSDDKSMERQNSRLEMRLNERLKLLEGQTRELIKLQRQLVLSGFHSTIPEFSDEGFVFDPESPNQEEEKFRVGRSMSVDQLSLSSRGRERERESGSSSRELTGKDT